MLIASDPAYYYYVSNGVITEPTDAERIYVSGLGLVTSNPFPWPYNIGNTSLGADTPDSFLADLGVYRLWIDDGGVKPDDNYVKETGDLVVNTVDGRVERMDFWRLATVAEIEAYRAQVLDSLDKERWRRQGLENAHVADPDGWDWSVGLAQGLRAVCYAMIQKNANNAQDLTAAEFLAALTTAPELAAAKAIRDAYLALRAQVNACTDIVCLVALEMAIVDDANWPAVPVQ